MRLTHKLVLVVLVLAAVEGAVMAWLLEASGVRSSVYLAAAAGVGAMLTGLLGLLVVRQVTRPLEAVAEAAREIDAGRLDVEIKARGPHEIAQLVETLREMQQRLRASYALLERRVEERTAELREAGEFLTAILDSSTEYAIIATDMDWTIQTFNEGARRTFGYEPDEIVGRSFERLVPAEEQDAAMGSGMLQMLRVQGRYEGEGSRLDAEGRRLPVRTVTTVRTDARGRPVGYTIVCRDITQRKALEARLREYTDNLEQMVAEKTAELREQSEELARANRLKSQFLANMSHELRTPLNAIIGFAEAIRDGVAGPVPDEAREFAEDIYQAGRQLLSMINNILDLSKFEAGAMDLSLQPCELAAIVEEVLRVVRGMAQRRGVELRRDIRPAPLELTADPAKLKQILYNLLSNAIKFTDAGGHVEVAARLEAETILIEVRDTGIGIAPEDLVWVFEEFRQADSSLARNHEGSGLGLALTRRFVELHGGEITVTSELGKGTAFQVSLLRDLVTEAEALDRADNP